METMQQPKITGYRQLNETEAALINKIKEHGIATRALIFEVGKYLAEQGMRAQMHASPMDTEEQRDARIDLRERFSGAQPMRWMNIATTHYQEAGMALTRAVAQPTSF